MQAFFSDIILFLESRRDAADPHYERLVDQTITFIKELKDQGNEHRELESEDNGDHYATVNAEASNFAEESACSSVPPPISQRFNYPPNTTPDCAICLDPVDSRSHAEAHLLCGHIFHLSCLGSAFNSTGIMQCPTCRRVQEDQPGGWKYAQAPMRQYQLSLQQHASAEEMARLLAHDIGIGNENTTSTGRNEYVLEAQTPNLQRGVLNVVNTLFSGRFNLGHPFRDEDDFDEPEIPQRHSLIPIHASGVGIDEDDYENSSQGARTFENATDGESDNTIEEYGESDSEDIPRLSISENSESGEDNWSSSSEYQDSPVEDSDDEDEIGILRSTFNQYDDDNENVSEDNFWDFGGAEGRSASPFTGVSTGDTHMHDGEQLERSIDMYTQAVWNFREGSDGQSHLQTPTLVGRNQSDNDIPQRYNRFNGEIDHQAPRLGFAEARRQNTPHYLLRSGSQRDLLLESAVEMLDTTSQRTVGDSRDGYLVEEGREADDESDESTSTQSLRIHPRRNDSDDNRTTSSDEGSGVADNSAQLSWGRSTPDESSDEEEIGRLERQINHRPITLPSWISASLRETFEHRNVGDQLEGYQSRSVRPVPPRPQPATRFSSSSPIPSFSLPSSLRDVLGRIRTRASIHSVPDHTDEHRREDEHIERIRELGLYSAYGQHDVEPQIRAQNIQRARNVIRDGKWRSCGGESLPNVGNSRNSTQPLSNCNKPSTGVDVSTDEDSDSSTILTTPSPLNYLRRKIAERGAGRWVEPPRYRDANLVEDNDGSLSSLHINNLSEENLDNRIAATYEQWSSRIDTGPMENRFFPEESVSFNDSDDEREMNSTIPRRSIWPREINEHEDDSGHAEDEADDESDWNNDY